MNRLRIINKPIRRTDLRFEDLDYDSSDSWLQRSRRLQARRWRQINKQFKARA